MDALEIALRCLDLQPGEKVLTTPFSAFATSLAILRAGGLPVFVDVDDAGNIDLDQSREVLSGDASIRFLLPVHLYGNPCDLEKLAALQFGIAHEIAVEARTARSLAATEVSIPIHPFLEDSEVATVIRAVNDYEA